MKKALAVAGIGAALLGGPLAGAGTASAYPGELAVNVCGLLDAVPNTSTIDRYFTISVNAGLDTYAAGAQLDASVSNYCPWHLGLLNYYRSLSGTAPLPYPGGGGGLLA